MPVFDSARSKTVQHVNRWPRGPYNPTTSQRCSSKCPVEQSGAIRRYADCAPAKNCVLTVLSSSLSNLGRSWLPENSVGRLPRSEDVQQDGIPRVMPKQLRSHWGYSLHRESCQRSPVAYHLIFNSA
jgi:hypothetical protein